MVAEYGAWSSDPTHIGANVQVQYVGLLCTFGLYCTPVRMRTVCSRITGRFWPFTQNTPILCTDVMPIRRIYAHICTEILKNFCT